MGSRFSVSQACRGSACEIVKGNMLSAEAYKSYEILTKDRTTYHDRFLLLATGTYRIYCRIVTDDERNPPNVLSLNHDGSKLLLQGADMDSDQLEVALFTFDIRPSLGTSDSEMQKRICTIFVNGKPVVPRGRVIKVVDGASPHPWILEESSHDHYSISSVVKTSNKQPPVKKSWTINRADGETYIGWRVADPDDLMDMYITGMYIKPSCIPLTRGSYKLLLILNDHRLRAIGHHNNRLVVLPQNTKASKIAKFKFILQTENFYGTYMQIYTDEKIIVPCRDKRIICMPSASNNSCYAWEVVQRGSYILSFYSNIYNSFYPNWCKWSLNAGADQKIPDRGVPLKLCEDLTSSPLIFYAMPSAIIESV